MRDPERQTRRVLDYLELPFEPACLAFHESRRYAATPSYAQVMEPINERSVNRYRHYIEHLAPFVPQLAPWIAAADYTVEPAN